MIVGLRPEDFEDAVARAGHGTRDRRSRRKIDVLESMGSEFYAYFTLESEKVSAQELRGAGRRRRRRPTCPTRRGRQVVARLESASKVRQGQELELWFNSEHLHLFDPENGLSLLAE